MTFHRRIWNCVDARVDTECRGLETPSWTAVWMILLARRSVDEASSEDLVRKEELNLAFSECPDLWNHLLGNTIEAMG